MTRGDAARFLVTRYLDSIVHSVGLSVAETCRSGVGDANANMNANAEDLQDIEDANADADRLDEVCFLFINGY